MKVLLIMKYGQIPKTLHQEEINPVIPLKNSPFRIAKETVKWESRGQAPFRAGISSFGFGGANAHVLIEEYKEKDKNDLCIFPGNGTENSGRIRMTGAENGDPCK